MSPEDFRRAIKRKWCPHRHKSGKMYAQTNLKVGGKWKRVLLHRYLLGDGAPPVIDHKDGNGLNCTRENLRPASRSQNQHNSGPRGGTSRFKGVSWSKVMRKWHAQITKDRAYHDLGYFEDEAVAARAYDAAAKELHGEFAYQNFPDETARDEMRRLLLPEVRLALAAREGGASC